MGARTGRAGLAALAAIATLAMAGTPAQAQDATAPQFANIFADHAVVQRDRPIAIWGSASAGTPITVSLAGKSARATADAGGHWRVTLPALPAGGPYTLSATGAGATATLADVMVGDVYLCSGQSNMEFPARQATGAWGGLVARPDPDLRFAIIPNRSAPTPQRDLADRAEWKVVSPETVGDASAVCFFMAQSLQQHEHVPVGFVSSDWGGTTIQGWISGDRLRTLPAYTAGEAAIDTLARDPAAARAAEAKRRQAWWNAHVPGAAGRLAWSRPGFDDSAWNTVAPDGGWKKAGPPALADFDGSLWYRNRVDLTAAQAAHGTTVELGPIDTIDDVWVNGRWVGGGNTAWAWRNYPIPAGLLHAGANTIAVRALNAPGGTGGMTGTADHRGIRLADDSFVTLPAQWRTHAGAALAQHPDLAPPPWEPPTSLSTLYNAMIAPIADYGFKLAAWYQGEANVGAADEYATLLPMLIADWRDRLHEPGLPFLIVQLADYGDPVSQPVESGWARLRDVQAKVARADPRAALALSVDVGDPYDIHPTQKRIVGQRLARAARAIAYGEDVTPSGPYPQGVTRDGSDLVVRFADTDGGLRTHGGNTALGFESCTPQACRYVTATASGDAVRLGGANRPDVVKLRYAWSDAPVVNLFGADGLPATPFEYDLQHSKPDGGENR